MKTQTLLGFEIEVLGLVADILCTLSTTKTNTLISKPKHYLFKQSGPTSMLITMFQFRRYGERSSAQLWQMCLLGPERDLPEVAQNCGAFKVEIGDRSMRRTIHAIYG